MKLFGFNITRHSTPVTKSFSPADWLAGRDLDQTPSGPLLTNAYEQIPWVYRAINVLAEQIANIPFLFSTGERGRETLITNGPLQDFYARPHPYINRFQYWELRIMWLMLRGECFRIPIYEDAATSSPSPGGEGRGEVAGSMPGLASSLSPSDGERAGVRGRRLSRVLILDPSHFHHIIENQQLIGWRYTGFGPQTPLASQVFLPEEVWFEKLPNPFDFWRGLAPLYVADMASKTDFAASSFMRGLIENNGDLGTIVRADQQLSDEQREQISAAIRQRKRRAGTADRPVLLWGATEIVKPDVSSADLQFLENRKFSRAEICAAFGVPEEIISGTEHAKYDVMQGARLNFIENRVAPLCSRLEAEEDVLVKSLDSKAVGWFDLESLPIMQQARRNRLASAQAAFGMGVPFNELNRVLDLGFKPLPWGNDGYIPSQFQKLGSTSSTGILPVVPSAASVPLAKPSDPAMSSLITAATNLLQAIRPKPQDSIEQMLHLLSSPHSQDKP